MFFHIACLLFVSFSPKNSSFNCLNSCVEILLPSPATDIKRLRLLLPDGLTASFAFCAASFTVFTTPFTLSAALATSVACFNTSAVVGWLADGWPFLLGKILILIFGSFFNTFLIPIFSGLFAVPLFFINFPFILWRLPNGIRLIDMIRTEPPFLARNTRIVPPWRAPPLFAKMFKMDINAFKPCLSFPLGITAFRGWLMSWSIGKLSAVFACRSAAPTLPNSSCSISSLTSCSSSNSCSSCSVSTGKSSMYDKNAVVVRAPWYCWWRSDLPSRYINTLGYANIFFFLHIGAHSFVVQSTFANRTKSAYSFLLASYAVFSQTGSKRWHQIHQGA